MFSYLKTAFIDLINFICASETLATDVVDKITKPDSLEEATLTLIGTVTVEYFIVIAIETYLSTIVTFTFFNTLPFIGLLLISTLILNWCWNSIKYLGDVHV